ncbi:hypothetical protein DFH07DRAFT_776063 [Mycena maculata]|uniref:Uncharacterized protein n=1 Tax=Mycena maculata TaxID=230809 RepID=A0AAD7IRT8_9AGAR|nr:hypothetical protein DFH07DRAFT_776063 [Mycena maculata]
MIQYVKSTGKVCDINPQRVSVSIFALDVRSRTNGRTLLKKYVRDTASGSSPSKRQAWWSAADAAHARETVTVQTILMQGNQKQTTSYESLQSPHSARRSFRHWTENVDGGRKNANPHQDRWNIGVGRMQGEIGQGSEFLGDGLEGADESERTRREEELGDLGGALSWTELVVVSDRATLATALCGSGSDEDDVMCVSEEGVAAEEVQLGTDFPETSLVAGGVWWCLHSAIQLIMPPPMGEVGTLKGRSCWGGYGCVVKLWRQQLPSTTGAVIYYRR